MSKVVIIGTTSWGTTLAILLGKKGLEVVLLARSSEEATELQQRRENTRLLPGFLLPSTVQVMLPSEQAFSKADVVILAVPSQSMRQNIRLVKTLLDSSTLVMSAAKGLEVETTLRMSEVLEEELPPGFQGNICVLSGPNLSLEVARGLPATSVVAARDLKTAQRVQSWLMTSRFRVYTNTDVIGVELGGGLKNIIALGAGMCDGWGYGDNAKAAFMTRGLAEISRLAMAAGANPLTLAGLAGLGDLVATCSSRLSRNHYVGEELAKGRKLKDILASVPYVAEGIPTTVAARQMARRLGIEMPITEQMYRVLFEDLDPHQAAIDLMEREAKHELAGILGWLQP